MSDRMADEPTLPTLPGSPWSTAAPQGLSAWPGRPKRHLRGVASPAYTNSSDPPVFSSDDSPALDNYTGDGRRKRRYVGAWFDQQPVLSSDASMDSGMGGEEEEPKMLRPAKRRRGPSTEPRGPRKMTRHLDLTEPRGPRKMTRHLDSGVWLARSDISSTDTEDLEDVVMEPAPPRLVLTGPALSVEEQEARALVRRCQEEGNESVDLNSFNLKTITDKTLEAINQITPIPNVDKDVFFEQRPPAIQLYLAANGIDRFPTGILNIQHLSVLSLRGNNLRELPPALASLKHLKFLNVAQNALQFLPAELLTLLHPRGRLVDLKCRPNPFFDIKEDSYHIYGSAEYESGTFGETEESCSEWGGFKLTAQLRARTPVQFSHRGTVVSSFKLPPSQEVSTAARWNIFLEQEEFWHLQKPKNVQHGQRRGPASLFEQALRVAVTRTDHDRIQKLMRDPMASEHFLPTFQRAVEMEAMGGQSCCVCKRDMVVPATEWVEFRELEWVKMDENGQLQSSADVNRALRNREECLVPFLRRGCSWQCIPVKVPEAPGMEETRPLVGGWP